MVMKGSLQFALLLLKMAKKKGKKKAALRQLF